MPVVDPAINPRRYDTMKNSKHISLALVIFMLIGLCAACAPSGTVDIPNPEDAVIAEDVIIDLSMEMVPLSAFPAVSTLLLPIASGTLVERNTKAEIDYSNTGDGYVMVKWLIATTTKQLRVQVIGPTGATYTYTIKPGDKYEVFPLSDGNGTYTVRVMEQTEGSKYAAAISIKVNVTLKDQFAPFLRPNQYVNYNADSKVVAKAAELLKGQNDFTSKIAAVYKFVVEGFTYDKERAQTVKSGYLPDVDDVLAKKKGICFDYAAVMAAMLRSQGVPVKLVVGYAGDVYHAWLSVYSDATGWVTGIFFDGKNWQLMDPTFESTSKNSSAFQEFIGDGSNYTAKYLY